MIYAKYHIFPYKSLINPPSIATPRQRLAKPHGLGCAPPGDHAGSVEGSRENGWSWEQSNDIGIQSIVINL